MKKGLVIYLVVIGVLAWSTFSSAYSVDLVDDTFYWDNWTGDEVDVIGIPEITKATVELEGTVLKKVTFTFQEWGTTDLYGLLQPGDLFLDIQTSSNPADVWDYVVSNVPNDPGMGDLYDVSDKNISINKADYNPEDPAYKLSELDGYNIRDEHPVWLADSYKPDSAIVQVSVDWSPSMESPSFSFDFGGGFDLNPGSDAWALQIGWTVNCANDVFLETLPIPEPSTIFLIGLGLVGIVGLGWGRMKK